MPNGERNLRCVPKCSYRVLEMITGSLNLIASVSLTWEITLQFQLFTRSRVVILRKLEKWQVDPTACWVYCFTAFLAEI